MTTLQELNRMSRPELITIVERVEALMVEWDNACLDETWWYIDSLREAIHPAPEQSK